METSLLTTKLNIPPARPQMVARPRLTERLQEGLNYNLVLVSAPAGFGKTTLLSEFARHSQPQVRTAWLSLDTGDDDPVRFWDYFIAALKTLQPDVGEKILPWLHSYQLPSVEPMLDALINELSNIEGDFIVVLDDYHLIESQQIHDGINYLIDHMPLQMLLVIATRADPPLPLAHFRGKGTMLEISTNDLRFTRDDATSLLKALNTPEISTEQVAVLNERTEGWVVGLKMAALSLRGLKDIQGFITAFTGSQRYIMDYLMEEVLQKQTQEIRDFLLETSVLERLTAPLCDTVTGRQNSRDILLNLERGHLFIVPLDESRQWYRYEHLFADLLRHQCEINYRTEQLAELHRQASQWYEDNHFPDDAIHHALAAQDWERAVRIIENISRERLFRGEFVTLLNWFQLLPEDVLHSHLQLYLSYCVTLAVTGQLEDAESELKKIETITKGDAGFRGQIASTQIIICYARGDLPLAAESSRKALSLLPPEEIELRSHASYILGIICFSSGNFIEARPRLTEAYQGARQIGNLYIAAATLSLLAAIEGAEGKLRLTAEQNQQVIELVGPSPAAAVSHMSLGNILYEWNDLEAAIHYAQRAIELCRLSGDKEVLARVTALLAQYRLAGGDETGAIKALEEARKIAHDSGSPNVRAEHAAYHIQFALKQDDLATAEKWDNQLAKDVDTLPFYDRHIPLRLLIAQGKKSEALEKLRVLYDEVVESEAQRIMITCRVCQAMAAETEEAALEFLTDALKMAEPEGYIRTFVDEGKLLKPLLEKALSKGITPEYTRKLLTIIEAEERQKLKKKKGEGAPSPYQALLSERELDVLRLISEGLSNQQIADRLIISLSTAKNHVHNILEKLNVQGRTQAVAQARELELI